MSWLFGMGREEMRSDTLSPAKIAGGEAILNYWIATEALSPRVFKDRRLDVEIPRRNREGGLPAKAPIAYNSGQRDAVLPWLDPSMDPELRAIIAKSGIDQKEKRSVFWVLPLGFIDMKKAGAVLSTHFDALSDDDRERVREVSGGWACLGTACFDGAGRPIDKSVVLSSFGWACGEILSNRMEGLHRFPDLVENMCAALKDKLTAQHKKGYRLPTRQREIQAAKKELLKRLKLEKHVQLLGIEPCTHVIRHIVNSGNASEFNDGDLINSFYLGELSLVRDNLRTLDPASPVARYLGLGNQLSEITDPLANRVTLERLLRPESFPLGRWPSPDPVKLVTLQQAAVNTLVEEVEEGGLFAINGPPGTGKTTLLRDVIADVIVRRATVMATFDDPQSAFSDSGQTVSFGSYEPKVFRLDKKLRGFGMVVASNNGKAVENISLEIPALKAVKKAPDHNDEPFVTYFRYVADLLTGEKSSWGLCAAELGRSDNCWKFVQASWWGVSNDREDPADGLQTYFQTMFNRNRQSAIFDDGETPESLNAAKLVWQRARQHFEETCLAAQQNNALKQDSRQLIAQASQLTDRLNDCQSALRTSQIDYHARRDHLAAREAERERRLKNLQDYRRDAERILQARSLVRRIFGGRGWENQFSEVNNLVLKTIQALDVVETELVDAKAALNKAEIDRAARERDLAEAEDAMAAFQSAKAKLADQHLEARAGFWEQDAETLHKAAPWSDAVSTNIRDDVFRAAILLHKAFIDAAKWRIQPNLSIIMSHIGGKHVSSDADHLLDDLWDCFFILTPLYSTTFASAGRMFRGMKPGSLGWLLIDEAGQASPQVAAGALMRAKRAVIIGDPLQIEPVVTLPEGMRRSLANCYGLEAETWSGHWASCQRLADRVAAHQSLMGMQSVGFPLLVHRRCSDPMFTIANEIAYAGKMVHAVEALPSRYLAVLPGEIAGSCWLNVEGSAQKYCSMEGDAAAHVLQCLLTTDPPDAPDIYFISPFREVANALRERLAKVFAHNRRSMPARKREEWLKTHVGTIHTFQGKEADTVCLVLGASSDVANGSRSWAGQAPNILNVAVTRAKRLLIIIGHRKKWRTAGVFAVAGNPAYLPVVDYQDELFSNARGSEDQMDALHGH